MALIVAVFVRGVLSKPSILQSVNLPDGSALNLHTVLVLPVEDSNAAMKRFVGDRRGFGGPDSAPELLLLFSRTNPKTDEWLDLSQFGSVCVTDQFGGEAISDTDGYLLMEGESKLLGLSRSSGSQSDWTAAGQLPIKQGYRYLVVPMPIPQCDQPAVFRVYDGTKSLLAEFCPDIELPAPLADDNELQVTLSAEKNEWSVDLTKMKFFAPRGNGLMNGRPTSQVGLWPDFEVRRNQQPLMLNELILVDVQFQDAMGNLASTYGRALPTGPPTWKLKIKVARSSTAEFAEAELTALADVSLTEQPAIVETLSGNGPSHLLLIPPGKHDTQLPRDKFDWGGSTERQDATKRPRDGQFIAGLRAADLGWMMNSNTFPRASHGGGGSQGGGGWEAHCQMWPTILTESGERSFSFEFEATSKSENILLSCNSKLPTIIVACPHDRPEQVISLQVRDKLGNRGPTYSVPHPIANLPIYAILTNPDQTDDLSISYFTEDLTQLEFQIPSPYTVVKEPEDPMEPINAILNVDEAVWELTN